MNLIRQRDDLKEANQAGAISKAQLELALAAPVFFWHHGNISLTNDEEQWLYDNVMEPFGIDSYFPRITPFPEFRLNYSDVPVYEQIFVSDQKFLCFRSEDRYSHPDIKLWTVHFTERGWDKYRMWIYANGKKLDMDTRRAGRIELKSDMSEIENLGSAPMNNLAFFLFDLMAGVSTVVKVTSDQPGRSVEWHKAREHYLMINRAGAQTMRETKRDPTMESILRSAHWRRAHLRRLMSDKWTHKKGLLVPVRKAWVGPDEWTGTDGKIYKVQNIVPQRLI